jgi:dihydroorotase-like cyclic amidohydrolase
MCDAQHGSAHRSPQRRGRHSGARKERRQRRQILPIASVSIEAKNEQLAEMAELKVAGAIAVSDDAFPMQDAGFMRRVFQYAKTATSSRCCTAKTSP